MTIFIFTIVSFIQWELYHLRPTLILPDSWHLSMTHNYWITNCWTMICLQSPSSPSHCCIWRVWSLWQVFSPWHEPNMVHIRLPFLKPDLWDVHSCSLLFVGALPLPGWHDYRPAFNSINRPRFRCWAESQSDWLRPGIFRGRQQRQWNSVDETACAEVTVTAHSWI